MALPLRADRVTRQRGERAAGALSVAPRAGGARRPVAGWRHFRSAALSCLPPCASSAPLDMSTRKMLAALVAFFVVARSTAQGPQKYHCANMCVRNELPCPSPCHHCPKPPPCTTPVCPHPECPHIKSLPNCPDPVCGPLPKIPACPTPLVKLSCPHVACPQHSCPACPRCPDILPCPVCPTAPPTTRPTTITTTKATTTRATTTRTTTQAFTIATTPMTKPPPVTVTSPKTTGVTAATQSKSTRIIELLTTMGTTAPVTRTGERTTGEPLSKPEPARTTVAEAKRSAMPEVSTVARETGTSEPAEETSRPLPAGYERAFGVGVFKYFPNKMAWFAANSTCGNDGAYLAIPRTAEQKDFLIRMTGTEIIHVGFYSPGRAFITALGEVMTAEEQSLWARGEPSGGPMYSCAYLARRGLVSHMCSDRESFVCQLS